MIEQIFILLLVFQLKHWLCDYPLQRPWMLKKFLPNWDFFLPLLAHSGTHALFTLAICLVVRPSFWWLSLIDLGAHFVMDRVKAGPKYLGRFKALSSADFKMCYEAHSENKAIRKFTEYNNDRHSGELEVVSPTFAKKRLRGNVLFWWGLGLDQGFHHITHYLIIYTLVCW